MRQRVVDALTPLDIEVAWGNYEGNQTNISSSQFIIMPLLTNAMIAIYLKFIM